MLDLITLLAAPAAALMLALPFGMHPRTTAEDRQMRAVYLFHRTGEPIAMVAPRPRPSVRAGTARADHLDGPRLRRDQHAKEPGLRRHEHALRRGSARRGPRGPRQRVRRVPEREHVGDPT